VRPAIFLDRDGTLVHDGGYLHRPEDYRRLPGVAEGLGLLRDAGFRLVLVTNQSGIGRGYFGAEDLARFQQALAADLGSLGIELDGTYVCPHRPEEGCACRKPRPGLVHRAIRELDLDPARSFAVGDRPRDVELARTVPLRGGVLVARPDAVGAAEDAGATLPPNVVRAPDLATAARIILDWPGSEPPRPRSRGNA